MHNVRVVIQVEQTFCTISLTIHYQVFPQVLQITQIHTTVLLLQPVTGKSQIARLFNVSYASQVSHVLYDFTLCRPN